METLLVCNFVNRGNQLVVTFLQKTLMVLVERELNGSWRSCFHYKGESSRSWTIDSCQQVPIFFRNMVEYWNYINRQDVTLFCYFTGYLYALGLSELALGLAMAACGITGIIATFLFTRIRKCMGLERTGVLAFSLEISCLVLCLVSVWAPGSPFDPNYLQNRSDTKGEGSQKQYCELSSLNSTLCINVPMAKDANGTLDAVTKDSTQALLGNSTMSPPGNRTGEPVEKTSAILFVVGVITSRVGTSSATSY